MASKGKAVASRECFVLSNVGVLYISVLRFVETGKRSLSVLATMYIIVAIIRIELLECKVFDKENRKKNNSQFCCSPVLYLSDVFRARWGSRFL